MELVDDIGDQRKCCLTCWEHAAYWQAVESAISRGVLPAPSRVQDYTRGRKLAGRGFYFPITELERVKAWLAQLIRPVPAAPALAEG